MDGAKQNGRRLGRQLSVDDMLQISPIPHDTCLTFSEADDSLVAACAENEDDADSEFSFPPRKTTEKQQQAENKKGAPSIKRTSTEAAIVHTHAESNGDDCRGLIASESPSLVQVGSFPYRDLCIFIFKMKTGQADDVFYYEPIVSLDPKTIARKHVQGNQHEVTFIAELWNAHLESQIVKYLQEEEGFDQKKRIQVRVMPYEEVRLVDLGYYDDGQTTGKNNGTFQLPSRPRSYLQRNKSLTFGLLCSSKEAAEMVSDPTFLAFHVGLSFTSPAASTGDHPNGRAASGVIQRSTLFELNILHESDEENLKKTRDLQKDVIKEALAPVQQLLQDTGVRVDKIFQKLKQFDAQLKSLKEEFNDFSKFNKSAVPIFSAYKAAHCDAVGQRVTYELLDFPVNMVHGSFDKDSGVFTAKTAGTYLFQFNGVGYNKAEYKSTGANVALRVNDGVRANSFCLLESSSYDLYGSVALSSMVRLKSGDRVDIFIRSCALSELNGPNSRFSGLLLSY